MNIRQSLNVTLSTLRTGGIPEWRIEAEVLLRHVLGTDRSEFLALVYGADVGLTSDQSHQLQSLVSRRLLREPLAYIVGRREFYGLDLHVTDDVLIPRQETELLVDLALEHLALSSALSPLIADVGTGSGALALAIATHCSTANVVATDISQGALEVARGNAIHLGLSDRIAFVHGDMLSPIQRPIDVVVANLPYIPSDEITDLAVEVQREPRLALDGGEDGLAPLRRLFVQATGNLAVGGVIIVELMPEQMDKARMLAVDVMGRDVEVATHKDLMGNERALVVRRLSNATFAQNDWN